MFEDLVSSLLSKYLGDYLEGLSKQDLKLSLWKGDVELKNIRVKTEALDFLNLPIQVKEGFVGCLSLKIPWKHLGKEITKISIDDVYVIACPQSELKYNEEEEKEKAQQRKREQLIAIEENGIRMDAEMNAKENNSAVAKLVAKIINNIQISINRVHIRFEDHSSIPGHHFAAGVILEKLHLYTPSSESDDPDLLIPGVMRKKVRLSRFGVYWDFDEGARIRTKTVDSLQEEMNYPFESLEKIPSGKEGLFPRHWIIEPISLSLHVKADTRKTEIRKPSYQDAIEVVMKELQWSEKVDETKRIMHAYKHVRKDGVRGRTAEEEWVLMKEYLDKKHPGVYENEAEKMAKNFCYRCWDVSNTPSPLIEVTGEMSKIMIQLEQKQYRDLLGFVSALNTQTLKAKYKQFRPRKETAEQNPRRWWKFAIQSVMWENERQRTNRGWKQVMQFKKQRAEYIELYKRKNGMKPALKKDPKGLAKLQKLEEKLSLENILLFRKVALQEMAEEEKLKAKKKEREKKEKREKNVFLKMFKKKKSDDSDSEEEVDLDEVWNEDKRQQLFAEFDVNPDEVAPWEGGRPTDIQLTLQFKLKQVGVSFLNHGSKVMLCSLDGLSTQVIKRKSYLQVFAGVNNMRIEDGSKRCEKWPSVVYAEKDAISDKKKMELFLPPVLLDSEEIPFLQAAVEIPSMTKDVDMTIKARTLPLCVVGNVAFIMDLAAFVVPELSKLNFAALSASAGSLYNQLSSTKKLKLKASKEVLTHKNMGLDVLVGALHVILPEDINKDVTQTQCVVLRLGDINVKSDPKRVSVDDKLTEDNIYDEIQIQVQRINTIFTNYEKHWARRDVQEKQNLHLIDDFNCAASIGLSIAPSQTDFASTKIVASADMVNVNLTKQKYLGLMKFGTAFAKNVSEIIEESNVDFSSLTEQAKQAVSNTLAEKNEEEKNGEEVVVVNTAEIREEKKQASEYSDEEIRLLQQNRTLSIAATLEGVSVLIEEVSTANERTKIARATVAGLHVGMEQRTFDMNVNVSLKCIEVVDCLQSASTGRTEYLVASKPINHKGEVEEEKTKELFKIMVGIVNADSPDYATSESDVSVSVEFGALSVLAYRPTVYHLLKFIAPESEQEKKEEEEKRRRRRSSSASSLSSVASYISTIIDKEGTSIQSRAAELIKNKSNSLARVEQAKPLPANWTRKQVKVSLGIQALAIYLRADSGAGLLFGNIEGIRLGVAVCPATVSVEGSLLNIGLRDVSPGAGNYPHILEIIDRSEEERFIDFALTLYSDARYPRYPGYMMAVKGVIRSPSLCLRMRIIDELMRYVLAGPIADGLKLLQTEKPEEAEAEPVNLPATPLETIEEIEEEEEEGTFGKSIRDSVLLLGKSYLIPKKEKEEELPFVLPLIDLTLNSIKVSAPAASLSEEIATFELGSLTVKNSLPMQKEENDCIIVDPKSLKSTLNTVRVAISNMNATTTITTASGTHTIALLGGINLGVTAVVANVIEVNARITKMAVTVNEEQMAFAMKLLKGNFAEKAVLIEDELPKKEDEEPKKEVSTTETGKPKEEEKVEKKEEKPAEETMFGKYIRGQFCFDGIYIELLSGNEGYAGTHSGQQIYDAIGTLKNSISCVDIGVVDCFMQMQNTDISAGVSLSHVLIRDTRVDTPIHPCYRTPLSFGARGKPAISALVSLTTKDIHSFSELSDFYDGEQQTIQDIHASVNIGRIQVLPTPWIFDILKIVEGISKNLLGDEKKEEQVEAKKEEDSLSISTSQTSTTTVTESPVEKKKMLIPQVTASFIVEDPSIFIIEDPTREDSSSFLLSLTVSAYANISPLMNIDASVGIEKIRGCRSHPTDTSIPEPGFSDAIIPFNINMNLHMMDEMKKIQGTVTTNHDIEIRLGLLDAKLFTNFIDNLIPKEVKDEMKEKEEAAEEEVVKEEKKEEKKESKVDMELSFQAMMNSISITIVNDTKDFELPVMQLIVGDIHASVTSNMDGMNMDATLYLCADYYNADLTVWEPVIEKWEVNAAIEQESRDRVIQRLTALQSAGSRNDNSLLRVNLTTKTMLNCNITAAFIKTALQSLNAFLDCKDTTQKVGDSFYISIRNSSGLPINYLVENDNGINELVNAQLNQTIEKKLESAFFSGLAAVKTREGIATHWVALYVTSPYIRVFDSIPNSEECKPVVTSDQISFDQHDDSIFSEVCSFINEQRGPHILFVENDDEKEIWKKNINTALLGVPPEQKYMRSFINETSSLQNISSIIRTTLPSHPSLTLKYYKRPYKKIAPRSLLLTAEGYPSFPFMVDRSDCQFVNLKAEGKPTHKLFIENVIEKGKKIINISSSISVENRTAHELFAGFGPLVNDNDINSVKITSSTLKTKEIHWGACTELNTGLFLGTYNASRCFPVGDIIKKDYYDMVNITDEESPLYVNISCEKRTIHNSDDFSQTQDVYKIVISNVVTLENQLPVPIEYKIIDKFDSKVVDGSLKEGSPVSFSQCYFSKEKNYRISLRLKEDTFAYSLYAHSIDLFTPTGTVKLNDRNNFRNLNLSYTVVRDSTGMYTIQLYCDYWIMNKTGDTLIIRDNKDKEYEFTVPSNPLVLKNLSETVCSKEELLLPTLFSVGKKEKDDCAKISLPEYGDFSKAFSINTLGVSGTVTVASKDRKQPEKVYGVTISRGPGIFARSNVITLTPLYIIMNQTGVPVSLRQQDCDQSISIPEKQYSSFHWSSQSAAHKVQLFLDSMEYDWSQPFELVPSHVSLQMIKKKKQMDQYDSWNREELEDPVDSPYSIIQVDISMISSQCYIFLKKMDPSYMPFCISNNTALDCITITQDHSSWNHALTVQPLTSRLWTLPEVSSNATVHVYCKKLGTVSEKNDFSTKLTLDVTKPGKLGDFTMKNPNRTISVTLEMQKSMKVLVFEEVKAKKFSLLNKKSEKNRMQYLQERRTTLMQMSSDITEQIEDEMQNIIQYINEQEKMGSGLPTSARSTYLQIRNAYDTDLFCKKTMRVKVYFTVQGNQYDTPFIRGHLNYFGTYKIMSEIQEIEMKMEAKNDLQMTTMGYAKLKLDEFTEQDHLYDLVVPFYQEDGKKCLGYVNVRFVNCRDEAIAGYSFKKEELYEQKALIESAIQRIHTEAFIEKRFSKDSISSSKHVIRATHSGVYKSYASTSSRQSSVSSTMTVKQLNVFNEEENTDDIESSMNYCVMLNQLMKIPLPQEELKGIYVTAKIGQTELRIPASNQIAADPELYPNSSDDELLYEASPANLGCEFMKEGNTLFVSSVVKEGPADKIGVRVGHVVVSVDGGAVPATMDEFKNLCDTSDSISIAFVAPPVKELSAVLFCQQFIFPTGVTVNESTMQLSIFKETDKEQDQLLVSKDIPINRENDSSFDIRLNHAYSACLKSSWSSFNPEEELVSVALNLNFKGFGVSIINSTPSELLYLSINNLRADISLFESGKKTAEVKLKSLSVDNQIVGCRFPVFFGSPASDRDWLHASAIILPHPSVLYIEYFSLLIQEMKVNCDSRILMNLLQFISDIPLDLLQFTEKDPLSKLNEYPEFIKPMLIPDSSINSTSLFAEELELQPLLLTLTNKMDPAYPLTGSILPSIPFLVPVQALIDTAGTLIGNIDNAQIKLNSFAADSLFMTQRDLISRLTLHYVKQFVGQLYKIIGSFNFLGNPVGLAENLTSGVKAFFYEPMQGLVKSPKEFVGGIGRGTKLLLVNTAFGVLNTVSKITSTLADGLATLTMSEEYKNDRAAGKGGIVYGVKEGVTGLYKDTISGAKKGGFFGAVAGTGKGLVNLVVKPVVGVVDQTTKLFDNAKGITQVEKVLTRSREPRYIYKDHCLTGFSQYLATGQSLLNDCKADTSIPTGEEYIVHIKLDAKTVLIIGNSRFIWYDCNSKKIGQVIKYKHLVSIEQNQRSLQFIMDNHSKPMVTLPEPIACVIPALQNRVIRMKWSAVTNLVVRLLIAMKQPVSQEDRLLAEMEPITVGGPTLLESVSSAALHESAKSVTPAATPISTASENIDDFVITSAKVTGFHEGMTGSKGLLKNNTFTEYELLVEAAASKRKWVVYRRYSNFKDLLDVLKSVNPSKAKALKLPGKQLKLIQSKAMLEKRVGELNDFIEEVIDEEEFRTHEETVEFLKEDYVRMDPM